MDNNDFHGYERDRPGYDEADANAYPLIGTWTMRPVGYHQQSESEKREQRELFAMLDAHWQQQLEQA